MIQVLAGLAFFLCLIIHGHQVIKTHLCPSLVIDHQGEIKLGKLFTKNTSVQAKKIEFEYLRKCHDLMRLDQATSSYGQKRKVFFELNQKLEK